MASCLFHVTSSVNNEQIKKEQKFISLLIVLLNYAILVSLAPMV